MVGVMDSSISSSALSESNLHQVNDSHGTPVSLYRPVRHLTTPRLRASQEISWIEITRHELGHSHARKEML